MLRISFSYIGKKNVDIKQKCVQNRFIDMITFSFHGHKLRNYYYRMNFAGAGVLIIRHLTLNLALGRKEMQTDIGGYYGII